MQGSQQVRRPLVGIALSLVLGFLVQIGFSWPPLLALGFLSGGLAWACCTLSRRSSRSIYFVCALLAIAYGAIERVPYPSQSVLPVLEMEDDRQEMVGTIQNDPTFSSSDGTSSFRFQVEAVRLGEEWRPADSTVRVVVKTPRSVGRYGERWQLEGRYRQYGKRYSGIGGAFYVGESGADRLREAPFSLKGFCYQMRRRAVPVFQDEMGTFPEYSRVMNAMLLGIRKALSPELYQTFSLTGTLHIFG
ncbi:MAG: DUF4131 domain-containing protein, partial [Victivallales bacterium]|nr:DUF4131 domain-containing protein [Victivallales bacterium]